MYDIQTALGVVTHSMELFSFQEFQEVYVGVYFRWGFFL